MFFLIVIQLCQLLFYYSKLSSFILYISIFFNNEKLYYYLYYYNIYIYNQSQFYNFNLIKL